MTFYMKVYCIVVLNLYILLSKLVYSATFCNNWLLPLFYYMVPCNSCLHFLLPFTLGAKKDKIRVGVLP